MLEIFVTGDFSVSSLACYNRSFSRKQTRFNEYRISILDCNLTFPTKEVCCDPQKGENMKFCYADESGHGAEITVVVGVIVDSRRMHRTKADWNDLINDWNELVRTSDDSKSNRILELKGRELYRGNA